MELCFGGTSWVLLKEHYFNSLVKAIALHNKIITRTILKILFSTWTCSFYDDTEEKFSWCFVPERENVFWAAGLFFFLHLETHMIDPVSLLCLFTRKFRAKSIAHLLWVYSTILCIMLTSCFLSYFMFNFHDNILYTIFSLSSYLFALSYWVILCNHIVWRKAR